MLKDDDIEETNEENCEDFGDIENDYPVAKYINKNGFYIGCHHGLKIEDLDYIVSCIDNYMEELGV